MAYNGVFCQSTEDAASGAAAAPVEQAGFGAGSMWDDTLSSSGGTQGKAVVTRKGKGAKKRRSRVQGSGWADR